MPTRDQRIAEFNEGPPPSGVWLQLVAKNHHGTYLLSFPCEWRDNAWYPIDRATPLQAKVVGWRTWRW
jgi:hypothetical protein